MLPFQFGNFHLVFFWYLRYHIYSSINPIKDAVYILLNYTVQFLCHHAKLLVFLCVFGKTEGYTHKGYKNPIYFSFVPFYQKNNKLDQKLMVRSFSRAQSNWFITIALIFKKVQSNFSKILHLRCLSLFRMHLCFHSFFFLKKVLQ